MIDIITYDLEKLVENSIIELNKKIREDITNNLLKSISKKSIYELNDIINFGKLSDPTLSNIYKLSEKNFFPFEEFKKYHITFSKLKKNFCFDLSFKGKINHFKDTI